MPVKDSLIPVETVLKLIEFKRSGGVLFYSKEDKPVAAAYPVKTNYQYDIFKDVPFKLFEKI